MVESLEAKIPECSEAPASAHRIYTEAQQRQLLFELTRRLTQRPVLAYIPHSPSQQVALSTTCRGTVLVSGGNRSGKTDIGCVKVAAVAEDEHRYIMCPRDCPQYGYGTCGLHGCPSNTNGGTTSCEAAGRPVPCSRHRPLQMAGDVLPRKICIVGDELGKLYDDVYDAKLKKHLSKTLGGKITWKEPNQNAGDHFIRDNKGRYIIELISMAKGGKEAIRGNAYCLVLQNELSSLDLYREERMRILDNDGQILIVATPDALLDSKIDGQWIYPELVDRKMPSIQVLTISTRDNPIISPDALKELEAGMRSDEERQLRLDGAFGYRSARCAFSEFGLERQIANIRDPKRMWLTGVEPPTTNGADWEAYFSGPTRFPSKCNLPSVDKSVLLGSQQISGRGGVACLDCVKRCPFYERPPVMSARMVFEPKMVAKQEPGAVPVDVWEMPGKYSVYISGQDTAQGRLGGDFSVDEGFNAVTGEQAWELHCQLKPRQFAYATAGLYYLYNQHLMVPEYNGPGSQVISVWTEELGVKNIYADPTRKIRLPGGGSIPQPGFLTTEASKRDQLVRMLDEYLVSGDMKVRSARLLAELRNFVREGGKLAAMAGAHDDCTVGAGCAAVGWPYVNRTAAQNPDLPEVQYPDGSALALDSKFQREQDQQESDSTEDMGLFDRGPI